MNTLSFTSKVDKKVTALLHDVVTFVHTLMSNSSYKNFKEWHGMCAILHSVALVRATPACMNCAVIHVVKAIRRRAYERTIEKLYIHITRKMVPICLRVSSFPKSMSNNKHEQIQVSVQE